MNYVAPKGWLLLDPTRKGLVTGSVPTENLPLLRGRPRELQLFQPPVRILLDEFKITEQMHNFLGFLVGKILVWPAAPKKPC